jgi:hypothetical protein
LRVIFLWIILKIFIIFVIQSLISFILIIILRVIIKIAAKTYYKIWIWFLERIFISIMRFFVVTRRRTWWNWRLWLDWSCWDHFYFFLMMISWLWSYRCERNIRLRWGLRFGNSRGTLGCPAKQATDTKRHKGSVLLILRIVPSVGSLGIPCLLCRDDDRFFAIISFLLGWSLFMYWERWDWISHLLHTLVFKIGSGR